MHIEFASEAHYESLVELLCELHAHHNQGAVVSRQAMRGHLQENLMAAGSPLRLVVAADNNGVVGLAAISLAYSLVEPLADKCRQCHLKELYVRSSARSRGIGKALMSWVARYASEHGCCRIDWHVRASNDKGISFYTELGAAPVAERLSYRLSKSAMDALAREGSSSLMS